ncbi:hypothetical protein RJ640_028305 [Escallonia rubra]|uniref:DUF4005 domain-containing protein n=1 Tax=Escallonia rubra TaxID=112253 RepID=A0AA88UWU6_9ASTE|nr:hypothetical protein RJ640_028305 [Escallonia rubra]
MGKIGGSSWLNAVKKAFRSPTKDNSKRSSRSREEHEQEEEEKKRGKRRWIFKKPYHHETTIQHNEAKNITTTTLNTLFSSRTTANNAVAEAADVDQRRAIAMAMATTAAAEAAVATAQAAVEVIRLTRHSRFFKEHHAATVIQTAFRGYLARRALRALKGLVKLQALVRGHNVRKRAKMTLRCIQALVRVQTRVRDQRRRLSYEGSIDSASSEPKSYWESHHADRKSTGFDRVSNFVTQSGDGNAIAIPDEWDSHLHTVEEFETLLQRTKEAALKREKALAQAFSNQVLNYCVPVSMWRSGTDQFPGNEEQQEANFRWEKTGRYSCDQRVPIKNVEMDTAQPYSYSAPNFPRSPKHCYHYQQPKSHSYYASSPLHRTHQNLSIHSPATPSPSIPKSLQVHSASPRCLRGERTYPMSQTPTLRSSYYHGLRESGNAGAAPIPNYMAATASAKARVRSQSAPRQRPLTPEREKVGSAKKRLSFPVPDPCNDFVSSDVDLESPRYRTIDGDRFEVEQRSNMSSYCNDSQGDERSPPMNDLRRWLR